MAKQTYFNPFKPRALLWYMTNSAEPGQSPQIQAYGQVLHCLLTECSIGLNGFKASLHVHAQQKIQ